MLTSLRYFQQLKGIYVPIWTEYSALFLNFGRNKMCKDFSTLLLLGDCEACRADCNCFLLLTLNSYVFFSTHNLIQIQFSFSSRIRQTKRT